MDDLLTIDHLHQYAYCPRRMHLMYVDGRWDDNEFTEEGRVAHRRTDDEADPLPEPAADAEGGEAPPEISRSVMLSDGSMGLIGKLDLVETDHGCAIPVETKRGHPPDVPGHCYEPERVQLMAQALLLRAHGYKCEYGMLYFAGARRRVVVPFTPELEERTRFLLAQARSLLEKPDPPPPLEDSPKCQGCSLAAICLPDETNLLLARGASEPADIRRLYPARDDALPLYVQEQGARVGKEGQALSITREGRELARVPLKDVSQLVLCGNVSISAQAMHLLCESGIPVVHLSTGGWFYGLTAGHSLKNAYARAAQFRASEDSARCLRFARIIVEAKARNQRTLLRRNGCNVESALEEMSRLIELVPAAESPEALLGLEGSVAAIYFRFWTSMLAELPWTPAFDQFARNRRPPRDPINALLSYAYALLVKDCTVALLSEGLDPWWGLYHRPRHGRPALALDLMEEFRPLIADSAVLSAFNNRMVGPRDFEVGANGCLMKKSARKAIMQAYEQRMDQMMTHPVFNYRCSWRAIVRLQARLLARWLRGEIPDYTGITTR